MSTTYSEGECIKTISIFNILFKIRNWRIIEITGDDPNYEGPSMYHISCKYVTHILYKKKATCYGCNVVIPNSIQVVYTMLNFNNGEDQSYFRQGTRERS